jgi:GNAT superfamily N-acetyltransferase
MRVSSSVIEEPAGPSKARHATGADTAALAAVMARAFLDDPFVSYLVPGEDTRARKLPGLFALLFKLARPYGACDVTVRVESVALWRPPHHWHVPFWQYLTNGPRLLGIFGGNALRALNAMDRLERPHPRERHWYLQAIGTDPQFQGKGYGGVLLRHRLARIDAAGLPAYLEASKEANVPLYASFGFVVTGEIRMPDGPTLYPMWRPPRPIRYPDPTAHRDYIP